MKKKFYYLNAYKEQVSCIADWCSHVAHNTLANIGKLRSDTVGQRSEMSSLPIVHQLAIYQQWPDELLATMAQKFLATMAR